MCFASVDVSWSAMLQTLSYEFIYKNKTVREPESEEVSSLLLVFDISGLLEIVRIFEF